MAEQW